jgi:O-antigen chain-terminating methyltransferase
VDLDEGMLESCARLGLPAEKKEAVAFLSQVPSNSQAVVSAFHVVEHIAFEQLSMLVAEAHRVLVPGGIMILETPNAENPRVGSYTFFMDPTHQKPIPPPLLSFVAEHQGFQRVKILRLQESLRLEDNKPVSLLDVLTGVSPDYSIVAQKNGSSEVTASLDSAFSREYGIEIQQLTGRYDDSLRQGLEIGTQKTQELKAQQEEVVDRLIGEVKQGERSRLERLASDDHARNSMEERIAKVIRDVAEIQDFITASSRHPINRLLSWLGAPYRITKKKNQKFINKK